MWQQRPTDWRTSKYLPRMQKMGWRISERGACYGITMMWIQAVLVGEEEKFYQRFERICRLPDYHFNLETKELILNKFYKGIKLDKYEEEFLDIYSFMFGVSLYQNPEHHDEKVDFQKIFGQELKQRQAEEISQVAQSEKLKERKGLKQCTMNLQALNLLELKDYFNDLSLLAKEIQTQQLSDEEKTSKTKNDIVIRFGDYNHSIGFRYDITQQCWFICDPNHMPLQKVLPENIAIRIFQYFAAGDCLIFEPFLFTTNDNNLDLINSKLSYINEKYAVTPEKLKRSNEDGISIPLLAVKRNRRDYWSKEILNIADEKGNTPIHAIVASAFTRLNMRAITECGIDIGLLIKAGAQLNIKNAAGKTPIAMAADQNIFSLIVMMLKSIKNLNELHPDDIKIINQNETKIIESYFKLVHQDLILAKFADTAFSQFFNERKIEQWIDEQGVPAAISFANSKYSSKRELAKELVNVPDKNGNAPIHFVIASYTPMSSAVDKNKIYRDIQLLIDQGANIAIKNKIGKSPIAVACEKGLFDHVVLMLINLANLREINAQEVKSLIENKKQIKDAYTKLLADKKFILKQILATAKEENAFGQLWQTKPKFLGRKKTLQFDEKVSITVRRSFWKRTHASLDKLKSEEKSEPSLKPVSKA